MKMHINPQGVSPLRSGFSAGELQFCFKVTFRRKTRVLFEKYYSYRQAGIKRGPLK